MTAMPQLAAHLDRITGVAEQLGIELAQVEDLSDGLDDELLLA